jgi:RNA polymerase sigma-70 factor (ECF subfamily)
VSASQENRIAVRIRHDRSLFLWMTACPTEPTARDSLFQQWLEAHIGLMLKIVRAYADTPQDQEDLLQEVLLQLWCSLSAFRGDCKPSTWIYRVAFNTALSWRRGESRRRKGHEKFINLQPPEEAHSNLNPTRREDELVEQLYAAIRQLPKLDASLALMHLDGLSYQEMSQIAGISENYIGVKLNRIRKELLESLKGANREH